MRKSHVAIETFSPNLYMWPPSLLRLEIDITYACGFSCLNCNRMTAVAPADQSTDLTIAQMQRLIAESVELKWPWQKWSFLGGEPTVHPEFLEILNCAVQYRTDHNPMLQLQVSTHGAGKRTAALIERIQTSLPFVVIRNTNKTTRLQQSFDKINIAPMDQEKYVDQTHYAGCWIPTCCGIGLNFAGFYCCAVAGAIDRVCGYDLGVKSLAEVQSARLTEMYHAFCPKCGHYDPVTDFQGRSTSPFWERQINEHNMKHPKLKHY